MLGLSLLLAPQTAKNETLDPNSDAAKVQAVEIQKAEFEAEQKQKSIELTVKAEKLVGTKQGQCTIAVRNFLGIDRTEIHGYVQTTINSRDPVVGSIIVIVGNMRHAGVVLFSTPTDVYYYDSNGDLKGRGAIRNIKLDSPLIRGYHIIQII